MKKRFVGIGVATALTMSLGTAGLAFGANITQDDSSKVATVSASQNFPETYTVTIPEAITASATETSKTLAFTPANVLLNAGNSLTVKVGSKDVEMKLDGTATEADKILKATLNVDTITLAAAGETASEGSFVLTLPTGPKYAGTYSGTMTFTIGSGVSA